jgi:hypothetical protein
MLLGFAIFRLATPATETFSHPLRLYHWLVLAVVLVFFTYLKGYRAFQRRLSRRVVERALSLKDDPGIARVILAPAYCMGFFGVDSRMQRAMVGLTAGMICFVFIIRLIPQPWRGIVDLGLVLAFAWGFTATLVRVLKYAAGGPTS